MTDFYNNNDDLIRDKLKQHEFAQVPNAWENMSALLDQHQIVPKRAAGYWWSIPFVTAAALAGVIGLGVYLHSDASITAPTPQELTTKEDMAVREASTNKKVDLVKPTTPSNSISKTNGSVELPIKALEQQQVSKKIAKKAPTKASIVSPAKTKPKKIAAATKKNLSTPRATAPKRRKSKSKTYNFSLQGVVQKSNSENTTGRTLSNNSKKSIQKQKPRVKKTRTEVIYQYSTTPLRALQDRRKAMQQQNTIGNFGIGDELKIKKSPLKVAVFGGASAKMYRGTKELSISPYAGVSASYRVAKHHGIQAGVQYKNMGRLADPTTTNEHNTLSYHTATSTSKSYTVDRIDLLEMPLVYQFHPHPKYNIQAGVKAAWLFNKETSAPELNSVPNETMGLADFDFSILLGMEYCFNKHWSIGLQYSMGLVNLTQQAEAKHQTSMQSDISTGLDAQAKVQALSEQGELLVPVSNDIQHQQMIRLPSQLHNNDVQLLLKYTF